MPIPVNAWQQATPLHLLSLCRRLGVEQVGLANHLHVKPAAVSQWARGRRAVPQKYHAALRAYTAAALDKARQRHAKDVRELPTEAQPAAILAFERDLLGRWALEVLAEQGVMQALLREHYQQMGAILERDMLTVQDCEWLTALGESFLTQVNALATAAAAREGVSPEKDS